MKTYTQTKAPPPPPPPPPRGHTYSKLNYCTCIRHSFNLRLFMYTRSSITAITIAVGASAPIRVSADMKVELALFFFLASMDSSPRRRRSRDSGLFSSCVLVADSNVVCLTLLTTLEAARTAEGRALGAVVGVRLGRLVATIAVVDEGTGVGRREGACVCETLQQIESIIIIFNRTVRHFKKMHAELINPP